MKKFNKVLALGMAGSMALSMAACGGSSSSASTGTDGSSTSTAAPTAAPSKDVVTLKWVAVGSGMPSNYDAWLAQINPFWKIRSASTSTWRLSPGATGTPAAMLL